VIDKTRTTFVCYTKIYNNAYMDIFISVNDIQQNNGFTTYFYTQTSKKTYPQGSKLLQNQG